MKRLMQDGEKGSVACLGLASRFTKIIFRRYDDGVSAVTSGEDVTSVSSDSSQVLQTFPSFRCDVGSEVYFAFKLFIFLCLLG